MTKAIFTREEIKEFLDQNRFTGFGFPDTIFSWLLKDLLMRDRPRDTGDRESQQKQIRYLERK